MKARVEIGLIEKVRERISSLVREAPGTYKGLKYADVRLEVSEGRSAVSENGGEKQSAEDAECSFGVRVLAGEKAVAPGYQGQILGAADLPLLEKKISHGLKSAYLRAMANAKQKVLARRRLKQLGTRLSDTVLAPIEIHRDTVAADYKINPLTVPLDQIVTYTTSVSRALSSLDPKIKYNYVSTFTLMSRELFVSSEGSDIDQSFAITQGLVFVVAQGEKGSQELYDVVGHQKGWEVVVEGVQEEYIRNPDLMAFACALARDAIELSDSPLLPGTAHEVVVVTDPNYNALKSHEIVGHPTELDRALKMETAYAGRSWLLKDLTNTQIGKQIASPLVTAYSDPTLPGFGHYLYDHEGTRARKVVLIDQGVFKGFMNSRQTAAILGVEPNGSYKATDAFLVPLIRMSNTVFAPGTRDPQEIIREVDRGYYLVGQRIPSIAESRENFRISAKKVYEIRNGELGQLYRNGGMMADTKDYFMKVDAVGNDFRIFPVPNCGKGQPMQTKRMGNGGPTMRSLARLTGV